MSRHPLMRVTRRPITCIWELTRACNLRCIHCENFGGAAGKRELSFEAMLEVVQSLQSLGCKVVDITGGEPLLHPKWDALARALREAGMRTALITNGTLFDDKELAKALDVGIDIAAFSVDGPKAVHDEIRRRPGRFSFGKSPFELTMTNLQRALRKIEVTVITQVNRLNLPHLPEMHRMLGELGVEKWQIQLAVPTGRVLESKTPLIIAPHQLAELTTFISDANRNAARRNRPHIDTSDTIGYYTEREVYLRKRTTGQGIWLGCQAGIRSVAITYNGKVRGCSILPPEFDAGDLHESTLEEIWQDPKRFAYTTRFDAQKLEGECETCRYGALCRAGCTSMAFYTTGTIYSNPYCISRPGILTPTRAQCPPRKKGAACK